MLTIEKRTLAFSPAQAILAAMMERKIFDGVPVLILDGDDLPTDKDDLSRYIMDRVQSYDPLAASAMRRAYQSSRDETNALIAEERQIVGTVMPVEINWSPPDFRYAHETGKAGYKPLYGAIVIAAGMADDPEISLSYTDNISFAGLPPLTADHTAWRYQYLCHELGHVAGAAEPQADKIAGLFCRRAFPFTPVPLINADVRAVELVCTAVLVACGQVDAAATDAMARYGWPMVEANDRVMALPQQEIDAMTEQDILESRYEAYDHSLETPLALGAALRDAGLGPLLCATDMQSVAEGARRMESIILTLNDRPEIQKLARRFALAAQRLIGGEAAYQKPIKTDYAAGLLETLPSRSDTTMALAALSL
jgi:hypothetical protein